MSKLRDWLKDLLTGILGSILATVIIIFVPTLIGGIYAFYVGNTQTVWLVVLSILIVINTFFTLFLFWELRSQQKFLDQKLSRDIYMEIERKGESPYTMIKDRKNE